MEKRVVFNERWLPILLLMPQLLITVVFFFVPAAEALYQSLFRQDAFGLTVEFAGLENFRALFHDPTYLASFRTTALFSTGVTVLGLAIALVLAWFADRVIRAATLVKTLIVWPYAIAPAIAGVLWMFLFNPSLGLLSHWMKALGLDWNYLLNGTQALALVTFIAAWKQISYNFLFFLAGLQSIPRALLEAAAIDGARSWKRFWTIVFPLLTPTTFFLLVINLVYAFFDTFPIIDAVTQGGPAKSTEILVYKVYNDGFRGLDIGGSAAQSVVLMAVVIVLTIFQFRHLERRVSY
jgi:sn-glycerol 3-phosphate transport system permease protein